ncbi:MAG: hypothetical protein IT381_12195 [Deltaproteobacteria bacterium]|nr:hypothetical protein [Deltaproteobacteria bacterium]
MRALLVLCLLATPAFAAKKKDAPRGAATRDQLHDKAMSAYQALDFKTAADLFAREVAMLKPDDLGKPVELEARTRLVLSLYQADKKDAAIAEYKTLKQRFLRFQFDDNEVLPETIEFFDRAVPPVAPPPEDPTKPPDETPPKEQPKELTVVSPDSPRVVAPAVPPPTVQPVKRWHWYYLVPLGIGQFLAGSPVRGAIFAILQAGLIAADVALYVRFNQVATVVGNEARTPDPNGTRNLQTAMNVVFFSMLGSFVAGFIDGCLEP